MRTKHTCSEDCILRHSSGLRDDPSILLHTPNQPFIEVHNSAWSVVRVSKDGKDLIVRLSNDAS